MSYFKRSLRKRFIDLGLMITIIFLIIFWVYQPLFCSGTGTITLIEGDWYIDYQDRSYYISGIIIANPESFPETLKIANDGKEVYYIFQCGDPILAYLGPRVIWIDYLDLIHIYIMKQYFFYILIFLIGISIISYLYLNRNKFVFTTKMFK